MASNVSDYATETLVYASTEEINKTTDVAVVLAPNLTLTVTANSGGGSSSMYIYFYMTAVMSLLSISGALVIIVSYFLYKDLRMAGRTMLVYLSTADMFTALGNILGISWCMTRSSLTSSGSHVFCNLHAAITIFSSISSFLWIVAIAVHLYLCIVRNKSRLSKRLTKVYKLLCWGLPSIVTAVTLGFRVIGHDEELEEPSWCWIDPLQPNALFWQYFTGKGWEIGAYLATVVLYGRIKYFLVHTTNQSILKKTPTRPRGPHARVLEANRRLTFVPIVFILCRIWGTIRFLLGAHLHTKDVERSTSWIVPLQGIGDSAQGFANCVLFTLTTESFRSRVLSSCGRCTCLTSVKTRFEPHVNETDKSASGSAAGNGEGNRNVVYERSESCL